MPHINQNLIKRSADAVKLLIENSINTGASKVTVAFNTFFKNIEVSEDRNRVSAIRREIIQVTDNGNGISQTAVQTALAPIIDVAFVEIRTRQKNEKSGIFIAFEDSKITKQEDVSCDDGTSVSVKNLLWNKPERREHLKSPDKEFQYIISEIKRIALANPDIELEFLVNDNVIYRLQTTGFKQRILHIFGNNFSSKLLNIEAKTDTVNLYGFVTSPQSANKNPEQFLFVNGHFTQNKKIRNAILTAYENKLESENLPHYFIHIEVKTENENDICSVLTEAANKALETSNSLFD